MKNNDKETWERCLKCLLSLFPILDYISSSLSLYLYKFLVVLSRCVIVNLKENEMHVEGWKLIRWTRSGGPREDEYCKFLGSN